MAKTNTVRRWLWRWGPALAWMALIFALSAQSKTDLPDYGMFDLFVKKTAHLVAYGTLALLLAWALGGRRHWVGIVLLLTLLYAISDELHQTMVPGRNGRWYDVAIDMVGASLALVGLMVLQRWQRTRPWLHKVRRLRQAN